MCQRQKVLRPDREALDGENLRFVSERVREDSEEFNIKKEELEIRTDEWTGRRPNQELAFGQVGQGEGGVGATGLEEKEGGVLSSARLVDRGTTERHGCQRMGVCGAGANDPSKDQRAPEVGRRRLASH